MCGDDGLWCEGRLATEEVTTRDHWKHANILCGCGVVDNGIGLQDLSGVKLDFSNGIGVGTSEEDTENSSRVTLRRYNSCMESHITNVIPLMIMQVKYYGQYRTYHNNVLSTDTLQSTFTHISSSGHFMCSYCFWFL